MPWCEECEDVVDDEDLTEEGECPTCGTVLVEERRVPWYFKTMLLASVVYLGYRAYQGITWVAHHV
ncbi:MAG: hypothetical protein ACRDY3_14390 [Acidimicrobiales bacterium]